MIRRERTLTPVAERDAGVDQLVRVDGDAFVVEGVRFPRRQMRAGGRLESVRRRPDPDTWDSQLVDVPSPDSLQAEVPDAAEVFQYFSPAMARTLRRIAEAEGPAGQPKGRRGFVLLVGPTGCGKTTLAKTYCYLANQPVTELSFSGDTSLSDFYTSIELVRDDHTRQSTLTVPGPAVEAMLRGKKLLLNEINMLPPDLLTVFSQAMDTGRIVLSGTERGNVEVEVHPDFGLIGTANPNYVGTLDMGRAIERRFGRGLGYIEMDFLPADEEAAAIENEFARETIFARHDVRVSDPICRRLATLAASLRADPQIGNVMQNRLSTRALVHWLGVAQITGFPLVDVLEQALLTTVPADARVRAVQITREHLADLRLDSDATERLKPYRVAWPSLAPGEAIPVSAASPPVTHETRMPRPRPRPVIHRVRYVRHLDDGGKVLVVEPMYADGTRRYGLGFKLRAYDASGRQIRDAARVDALTALVQEEDGLNVPRSLGRRPRSDELLPCLTAHNVRALELAEAALLLGRPVYLAGPTGAGKSSTARTLAYLRGQPVVEVGFTGETAKTDLSAVRRLIAGETHWQTQAFLEALAEGDTIIANEYNLAYPDVHSLLNGIFDKGARYVLPDGRVYRLHPSARVIATGYLEGPGVKPLNEGVENRFGAVVGLDYPPIEDEVAIIRYVAPATDSAAVRRCVRLVDFCRRFVAGRADPSVFSGMSRPAQEALRQAARRAAISTAELVALARASDGPDFADRLRSGILDGAPESVQRVLEPVLLQYGLG